MPLPTNNRPHVSLSRAKRPLKNRNPQQPPAQAQPSPEQYYYQQPVAPVQQMPSNNMPYNNQNPYQQSPVYYGNDVNQGTQMNNIQVHPVEQQAMMPPQPQYQQPDADNGYYEQQPAPASQRRRRRNVNNDDNMSAPVYDLSNGYPKGLSEGVEVIRTIGGKKKKIHGIPYEALTEDIQQDLDEHPLDDAGQLRVFINDRFYGVGHYIELGSDAHANKFMNSLRAQGDRLL